MSSRLLKLRWPAECIACSSSLASGTGAWWDTQERSVTCMACHSGALQPAVADRPGRQLERGRPGASATREHRHRRSNREARTRRAHPRIGGLLLALRPEPQHESAWLQGALGERAVASYLERRTANGPAIVLYDRRMPGSHANIDVLAIAPTGVYVIDAKAIRGKVRVARPLLSTERLLIEGRNRTKLIDGLECQICAVRDALSAAGHPDVPVRGALCFTKAELPLLGTRKIRGHRLLGRRALAKTLNSKGALTSTTIDALAQALAGALTPA
jgi:Nuclease-related domain